MPVVPSAPAAQRRPSHANGYCPARFWGRALHKGLSPRNAAPRFLPNSPNPNPAGYFLKNSFFLFFFSGPDPAFSAFPASAEERRHSIALQSGHTASACAAGDSSRLSPRSWVCKWHCHSVSQADNLHRMMPPCTPSPFSAKLSGCLCFNSVSQFYRSNRYFCEGVNKVRKSF